MVRLAQEMHWTVTATVPWIFWMPTVRQTASSMHYWPDSTRHRFAVTESGSGTVDFNDFLIVSANFNQSGVFTEGDFDKDGMVGFSDFLIVSGSFNESGVAAAVPEPNALALLGIGGLVLAARRKRVGTRKSHSRNRRM